TKLDTPANLLAIAARRGQFLCGGALSPQLQQRYLSLRDKLRRIDYCPKSQAAKPAEQRDQYQACEGSERLGGVVDGRKVGLTYRLIFVWSEAKARQEAATRERHQAKIRAEFGVGQLWQRRDPRPNVRDVRLTYVREKVRLPLSRCCA